MSAPPSAAPNDAGAPPGGERSDADAGASGRGGLAAWLVGRPVTVLMLFLTLIGTGVMAYRRLPLTLLPEGFSGDSMSVLLPFPGAGPREVHDQLTRPVEEALRTIPGIHDVTSVSTEDLSRISITFGPDVDTDIAYGEVRDRIERVRSQLPPEMDRYRIHRFSEGALPVMWLGVQYDSEADDPFGPIERIVVPRLEGVDGVAKVGNFGIVDEVVRVFVDFELVKGYGIDLGDVIRKLQADNFTLPAGEIDDGGRTFALRVDARFETLDDLAAYPIGKGRVLGDIAEIVPTRAYRDSVWRINGRAAVGLSAYRESNENTIAVCERIEDALEELKADPRLSDVHVNVFFSQKDTILTALDSLRSSALWGGVFAVLVLGFFLRDLRMTLIAAAAIPASLLAALTATYFAGQTLNLMSLAGFTLAIGMLVDNAVVVIENIARKRVEGLDRPSAAAAGAGEVGLAVVTATLTSVVVFAPLVFMDAGRQVRVMVTALALPISFSLLASLLVALVFIPAFSARLMHDRAHTLITREISPRLVGSYRTALRWILSHRFGATLALLVVIILSSMASTGVPMAQEQDEETDRVQVNIDTPNYFTLSDTNEAYGKLEEWAAEHQAELGYDFYSANFDRRSGRLTFYAADDLPHDRRVAMRDRVRAELPSVPGVKTTIGWEANNAGKEIRIVIAGPDFGVLADLAEALKSRLAALTTPAGTRPQPLFENIQSDVDRGLDEVHLEVDRERAAELGVSPETVRGMIAWGLGGQRLPDLQVGDREIRMQIEYGKPTGESFTFLRNLGVPRDTGGTVPLASFADMSLSKSVGALVRRNNRTSISVTAKPTIDNVILVSSYLAESMRDFPLPEDYEWTEEGGRKDLEADMSELKKTLTLSIVLVYLLMAILLESIVLPIAILLSIPLALMGVFVALWATGFAMGVMVMMGLILLAGIVVNNAIVLLDRVQRLRAEGLGRDEALVRGGGERLRPILMTALTTIFGLMPMAMPTLFPGGTEESGYESMAVTVAGGLAFSTFFTLLVVPLFYTFFDDVGRVLASLVPGKRGAVATDARTAHPSPLG